jgi:hypothetical protein
MKSNKTLIYDIEACINHAMVGFKDYDTKKIKQFDCSEGKKIKKYIKGATLVGFNSNNFDDIILEKMIDGEDEKELFRITTDLIVHDGRRWDYRPKIHSVDLIEVAVGKASLKLYGARLGTKRIQDLPYDPTHKHTKKMWKKVCKYNKNDLKVTEELYDHLQPQLKLRADIGKQYGINVMSRSDAQVAEDIFAVELKKLGIDAKKVKKEKPREIVYEAPKAVKFKSKRLKQLVEDIESTIINVADSGSPMMPQWMKNEVIDIGGKTYNIGLGGIHSMEKSICHEGDMGNIDIASMYPSLIVTLGLHPPHLGKEWLTLYKKIKDVRMEAKRSGDMVTSNMFKIVLNGSYGKLGSLYSFLYAPELLLTVTLTGQLYMLMLIERLNNAKVNVVSANTDGLEILYDNNRDKVKEIVTQWEKETGMDMEYGSYKGLYSRDVNSYVAVYDGYTKSKGYYAEPDISKNPQYPIVTEAIRQHLLTGITLEKVIRDCTKLSDFCASKAVNGGALWSPETYPNTDEYEAYLLKVPFKQNKALEKRNENYQKEFVLMDKAKWFIGKTVRFYFSTEGKPLYNAKLGGKVPLTSDYNGCKPMMELTDKLPTDLDYEAYIDIAKKDLRLLGVEDD